MTRVQRRARTTPSARIGLRAARPDAHVAARLDAAERTSIETSGRHWLWGANTKIDSVNFETNDFAQLNGADGLIIASNIRYRETQPGRLFRNYYVQLDVSNDSTLRDAAQAGCCAEP